ncbi:MAG: acyl-CoA dehydrogenase C-terminal domain-containing protein [Proteobacteria bacterium]|nr:acyl-CoA dehydrogenase C-terminal domain-containing protein [Pseudomonadota bacterium]
MTYRAPLAEMEFCAARIIGQDRLAETELFAEATPETRSAILDEAAKLCEGALVPVNRDGDLHPARLENGVVRCPPGFRQAYAAIAEGGWVGITGNPEHGGMGLPQCFATFVTEMMASSCLALSVNPLLSQGQIEALEHHASDEIKALYLPKLTSGAWTGTMNLTEPQAGSDVGALATRAEPNGDGSYAISGQKIFISWGDHDLTGNICHLVLARLPDGAPGTRGISLFIVPKFIPDANGEPGVANSLGPVSLEHKLGLHGPPTAVMAFDRATGWLVGAEHGGMAAMFTMMNNARLGVGIQGLGLAETAYQSAVAYAKERLQGRALSGAQHPDKPADPILVHPDVRKNLLTMRATIEGCRALGIWVATAVDIAAKHPDEAARREAEDLVELLTPIVKAYFTDMGFEAANLGVQVFGGHGYIREHGMEQLVRDARIAQLYEGTNGIQALDLVGRKLPRHMGRALRRFFHPVFAFIEDNQAEPELAEFVLPLAKAFGRLQQATAWVAQQGLRDPEEAGAAASDYLRLFALTALAYIWARTAKVVLDKPEGERQAFHQAKLATARFYMTRILPQTSGLFAAINAGAKPIMAVEEAWF